jgi:hypothetical protein
MGRKSKAKFKLPGHTLPGINQKSETVNLSEGRSPSSAFQQKSPIKDMKKGKYEHPFEYDYGAMKQKAKNNMPLTEQEKLEKLRDYLLSDAVGLQSLEGVDDWIDGKGGVEKAYQEMLKMLDEPAEPLKIFEKGEPAFQQDDKKSKTETSTSTSTSKSKLILATSGKYKGQMVDSRTGLPPGVSIKTQQEITNADKIALLRAKMKTVEPFSEEEENIRQQILKLRGKK